MKRVTREDVTKAVGRVDDVTIAEIIGTGATAEELAEAQAWIVNSDALVPGSTYQAVIADLEKHNRRSRIALVGHEPGIGELAARLIGTRHPIEFKKGAVCRIDVESLPPAGPGTLKWFLTPKILRELRK